LRGRTFDGATQLVRSHGAEQVEPVLHEVGEIWMGSQLAEAVGAQGDDETSSVGEVDEPGEEPLTVRGALGEGQCFLALVDDQDVPVAGRCVNENVFGVEPGGDDADRAAVTHQGCRHPRPDQRRLAAPRRPDHGQDTRRIEPVQACDHVILAAEVCRRIGDVVRHEP